MAPLQPFFGSPEDTAPFDLARKLGEAPPLVSPFFIPDDVELTADLPAFHTFNHEPHQSPDSHCGAFARELIAGSHSTTDSPEAQRNHG